MWQDQPPVPNEMDFPPMVGQLRLPSLQQNKTTNDQQRHPQNQVEIQEPRRIQPTEMNLPTPKENHNTTQAINKMIDDKLEEFSKNLPNIIAEIVEKMSLQNSMSQNTSAHKKEAEKQIEKTREIENHDRWNLFTFS